MTHEYTLLVEGTILPGEEREPAAAIAWAAGTILAIGTSAQVRSISRGDSLVVDLVGAVVVPLGPDDAVAWPPAATLEIGAPADLAILDGDPRPGRGARPRVVAVLRGGHVVRGSLPVAG